MTVQESLGPRTATLGRLWRGRRAQLAHVSASGLRAELPGCGLRLRLREVVGVLGLVTFEYNIRKLRPKVLRKQTLPMRSKI